MAGIISNVAEDVRRLKEVKAAIEDVKKSLKGIDIRVNIDIKESVEARLKALSEQYTALVMKISEAEGKIMLSVNRINKASDAIIQAQERVSKITGGTTQQPSPTVTPSNISAETASIQAQAKAYADLKAEINDVLGTRDANVKRMVDEMNAIRLINAEIKVLTKSQGESGTLSSAQQKRLEQLNNSLLTHKTALSDVRQVLSNNVKMDNAAATSMNELSQSLSRMRIAYRDLTEEERKSPFGKELLSSIQQADAKIKELDSSIGNHARNVGNYKKEWNGLQNQMQMVARELPNFAISPQIGIMSLTNNLPYLADELKKAKDAHKEYVTAVKAGQKDLQKVPSVGKQVLSSLFSWQTGLIMIITLITAYRQEITEWCKGLFNAKDRLNAASEAQIRLNDAIRQGSKDAIRERTQLDLLYNKLKDTTISTKERNAAVSEWMKKNPQYTSVVNGEKTNINQLGIAYKELTRNIIASAQAKRIESLLVSGAEKQADLIGNVTNAIIARDEAQKKVNSSQSEYNKIKSKENKEILEIDKQSLNRRKKELIEAQDSLRKQTLINEDVKKNIKLDNLFPQPQKGTYDYWQQQVQIADSALKQIDSKQKELMDVGKFDGIDLNVVANYKAQNKLLKEAQEELKVYDTTGKYSRQEESATEKLRKQNDKLKELSSKQSIEQSRAEEDLQNQLAQSRINAMANGFDKVQAQRELDDKKEIQAIERQKEDYIRAYIQAQKELFNAEEDLKAQKDKNYKKRTFDPSSVSVGTSGFDTIISNTKTKQSNDSIAQQESDWNEYIIKYGTFLQKKQAITEKYNKLINEADTSGKAALLQKEMEEALSGLSVDKLKKEINWEVVFGDMSKVAKKQLQQVKNQLTEFKKSSEFKNATPEQVKVIEEALDKINSALVDKSGFFGGLGDSLADYKLKLEEAKKAQEEYDKALKTGNQALIEKATETRNTANANVTSSGTNVEKSGDKAVKNINAVSNAIIQLGKKDVSLTDIGSAVGALVDTLGKSGSMIGGIISAILSIIDAAGDIGTIQYGMNLVGNVATKVTDAFARDTEAITGIDMSWLRGADYDDYNELKEQYETINSIWDELIDKKTEYLEIGTTEERKRTEGEILDLIGKQEQAYRNLGIERLNAGASAGSHSIGVRIRKGMSDEGWSQWDNFANSISMNPDDIGGRLEGLFNLTGKQLEDLKGSAPDFWAKLDDDVRKYLDDIIKCGEQTEETTKKAEELWAGMSFDSMVDNFKSALSDMDSSTEDFADDFQQYMIDAMIDSFVNGEIFQKKLKDWHKKLAEYSESDKEITKEEKDSLKNDWDKMVQEGLDYRNNLFESMGFSNSSSTTQDSTSRGFGTEMTHEDAGELSGRFTALQISNEEIKNQSILQSQSLNLLTFKADALLAVNTEVRNIADETRTLIANSYLELQDIRENTGAIVKPIIQMQKDMEEVKKNTSKL